MQSDNDKQLDKLSDEADSVEKASCEERCEQRETEISRENAVFSENASDVQNDVPAGTEQIQQTSRSRFGRVLDIVLWVLVAVLALAVILRAFVFGKITISGESMTAFYYNDLSSAGYDPKLTYHSGDVVHVNKTAKPQRGDVAVFYKFRVDSKLKALFARSESGIGGKYEKLIKRIVALGGDKIWLEQKENGNYRLVIQTPQGEILYEDHYGKKHAAEEGEQVLDVQAFDLSVMGVGLGRLAYTSQEYPYVVKEGCFFALGDNRSDSADSRGDLGDVSLDQMYGVVI